MKADGYQPKTVGWCESVSLPDLGVPCIDGKIETGTQASTLYTSFIEHYRREGELWVRFCIDPLPEKEGFRFVCQAPVKSTKAVVSTENHEESFFLIETTVKLGGLRTSLDLVLKTQGSVKCSIQLGRNVLQDLNLQVDPSNSYLFGDPPEKHYERPVATLPS